MTIEITDVAGVGIETDDFGTPKFHEPDDNVDLFRSGIVAKGTYVNHNGQSVIQLTSLLPARELTISKESKLTPPIDPSSLTEDQRKKGFAMPPQAMIDVAEFRFRIRDRSGAISAADADPMRLAVGIAWDLYRPPSDLLLDDESSRRLLETAEKKRKDDVKAEHDAKTEQPKLIPAKPD